MPLANTASAFGRPAKTFHWTIALLIIALIPLGIVANNLPDTTSEEIARKATLFSIHKSLGLIVFILALARILWAIIQPKPEHLHPERTLSNLAADAAHWLLYGSMVLVPLSGWIHHAATTGFAPIFWPFGQSLPFVPKDPAVAELFAGLHVVFERVLVFTLLAHIAGALKHHLWDKDDTLRRMLPGLTVAGPASQPAQTVHSPAWIAPLAALAIFGGAVLTGGALGLYSHHETVAEAPALEAVASDWEVQEGEVGFAIRQLGSAVQGSFADWTAAISFSEEAVDGRHGTVDVTISIPSVAVGSVTSTALGADYFDAEQFPTATFTADLLPAEGDDTYLAQGTLTLKGTELAQEIPFTLTLDGDTATAELATTLDRRDFGIGLGQSDEGTLGFGVDVAVTVTATRGSSE